MTYWANYKESTLYDMAHWNALTYCDIGGPSHSASKLPVAVYEGEV